MSVQSVKGVDNVISKMGELDGVFTRANRINVEKKRIINKFKPKKTPIVCDYCMMIGHVWH